jgi:hypothetical protein
MSSEPSTPDLGAKLYADVVAYGSRPSHRTGTVDDEATIDWFQSVLLSDGAKVQVDSWSFPRWTATWAAELDGQPIDALPLFYESCNWSKPTLLDRLKRVEKELVHR